MTQRELTAQDYLAMLRRRWVLLLILTLVGGPLGYGVSRILPNRYTSETLVLIEQPTVPTDYVRPVVSSDLGQRLSSMKQQILSGSRLEPIIRQYGLYSSEIDHVSMGDLVERLRDTIKITPIRPMEATAAQNLPGFFINVTMDNPRTAQEVCAAVTSMFIEQNLRLRQKHAEDTTEFLAQQLVDAKAKLDQQDAKLAAFKSHYLGELPDQETTNLNLLTGLTSQLDATTQALARAQQDKSFAETTLTQQISSWQAAQSGHNPETLEQQLSALQTQLANLQLRYTDDYPDVVKAKNDVEVLKRKIAESEAQTSPTNSEKKQKPSSEPAQIQQLRTQIHSYDLMIAEKTKEQEKIRQQINLYQERVQSSPAIEQQYKEVTRDYQTALDFYNELLRKKDQSAMATDLEHRQEGEQFRVLDPANLPDKPSFPDRIKFSLGGFAGGLALGLGIAFLLEMKDSSLRTERDVEFALRLPVLALIPDIDPSSSKKPMHPAKIVPDQMQAAVGGRA